MVHQIDINSSISGEKTPINVMFCKSRWPCYKNKDIKVAWSFFVFESMVLHSTEQFLQSVSKCKNISLFLGMNVSYKEY